MGINFMDASNRHWDGAELLYSDSHLANADHLYGLSAECGLKALMVAMGAPTDPVGDMLKPHKKHIDQLWGEFQSFASGLSGSAYVAMLPAGSPFSNWAIQQRYEHRVFANQSLVDDHRVAARQVRAVLDHAVLDGRFS